MQSVLITGASSGSDRLTMETFARRSLTKLAELHERGGRDDPSWEETAAAANAFGTPP